MRNVFTVILIGLLCYSCSERTDTDLNKEIFEFILKDRIKLNSTVQIIQESNDSIGIFNLTLIENSFSDIEIDTTKNEVRIFSYNTPPLSHPFFKDSMLFIKNQIENLECSLWDTTSLNINIEIDSPLKEYGDTIRNKTGLWLARNEDKAFLQISEPVYNVNGEVMVSALITLKDYVIDKSYVLNKVNRQWEIKEFSTLVGKYSDSEIEEVINPDGEKIIAKSRYLIVIGYYDI